MALATLLSACQNIDAPSATSNGEPSQTAANTTAVAQWTGRDPSLPDAATVFRAQDAADKAKAMQETAALQKEPARRESMTRQEESKTMPLPGQGTDDSVTGLGKNTQN